MLNRLVVLLLLIFGLNVNSFSQVRKSIVLDLSFSGIQTLDTSVISTQDVQVLILDGNKIDLFSCAPFIETLTSLEHLSLRNCNLDIIPIEISALKNLKTLDLSGNQLRFLPFSLKELNQLENLNVSNNKLDSLGFQIGRLNALKEIDLSGNKRIDLSAQNFQDVKLDVFKAIGVDVLPVSLKGNKSIRKLIIGDNVNSDLGGLIKDSTGIEEVFIYSEKRSEFGTFVNDLKKSNVQTLAIGSKRLKLLPSAISRLDSLKELEILKSPIKQLPSSFNQLQNLEKLTVDAPELKLLSSSINRLKQLKYLNIVNTNIDSIELKRIIKALPKTEIVYNPKLMGKSAVVEKENTPEIDINNIEFTKVEKRIDPKNNAVLNLSKGSVLSIPANAFVDEKGDLIEDSVVVKVKELNDPLSLFVEQVSLEVEGDNGSNRLAPTKTYLISATTSNNDSVFVNPENKPVLSVPQKDNGDVYVFKVKKNKWNSQDSLNNRLARLDSMLQVRKDLKMIYSPFTDRVVYDKVYLQMKEKKNYGGTCIRIMGFANGVLKKKFGSADGSKISFHQINAISSIEWLIVSENPEIEKDLLRSLLDPKKKTSSPTTKGYLIKDLEDFTIAYDSLKDVLIFSFLTKDKLVEIDVIPTSDVYDQINGAQREVARVFKKYIKNRRQIEKKNENVHLGFKNKYTNYLRGYRRFNDSLSRGEDDFEEYESNSYLYKDIENYFRPSSDIDVAQFGLFSIGNLESEIDRSTLQEASIVPVDSLGNKLAVVNLVILAKWGNTYRYGTPQNFEYPILKKVALLGLLANGDYALLNSSKFWQLRMKDDAVSFGEIEFEIVEGQDFSIEVYRDKLKI